MNCRSSFLDAGGIFQLWWQGQVDHTAHQAHNITMQAITLEYWWPFIVWLHGMKRLILDDFQQYRQMYHIFRNRASVNLLMAHGLTPDTDFSLRLDTIRTARYFIDCLDITGFFPSYDHICSLLKQILLDVKWKECMLSVSQLVPQVTASMFMIEDVNNLRATCRFFHNSSMDIVVSIRFLLDQDRPWAVFLNARPSIPDVSIQALGQLWPVSDMH